MEKFSETKKKRDSQSHNNISQIGHEQKVSGATKRKSHIQLPDAFGSISPRTTFDILSPRSKQQPGVKVNLHSVNTSAKSEAMFSLHFEQGS